MKGVVDSANERKSFFFHSRHACIIYHKNKLSLLPAWTFHKVKLMSAGAKVAQIRFKDCNHFKQSCRRNQTIPCMVPNIYFD